MTRIGLGRRLALLEQDQPAKLPLSVQRWLGEPLTAEQHRIADAEIDAISRFVGPANLCGADATMREWLAEREIHHANRCSPCTAESRNG